MASKTCMCNKYVIVINIKYILEHARSLILTLSKSSSIYPCTTFIPVRPVIDIVLWYIIMLLPLLLYLNNFSFRESQSLES